MSISTALAAERILTELEGASQLALSERGDCLHVTIDPQVQRPHDELGVARRVRCAWELGELS
ncbi:MAG TPA: hypothetical protein VN840_03360 [Streptosporangiaceae bacterium]|nr:hypothetical protein [Streptosporangiaceae bacterium]